MLAWLVDTIAFFRLQHDAHREFGMSIEDHLRHRERIGDQPHPSHASALADCIAADELWELRATLPDGAAVNLFGPDLESCIAAVQERMAAQESLAA